MAFDTFTGNDSAMLDNANDRITVTKAGIYQITAQIYCGNGTLGTLYGLSIDINGTQEALQFAASPYGFSRAMANVSWV